MNGKLTNKLTHDHHVGTSLSVACELHIELGASASGAVFKTVNR